MSFEADRELRGELRSGERLLWSGKPRGGVRLSAGDIFMIPFSLVWGGFAIFWEYSVIREGAPLFFLLWGLPFVLIGLHLIVGRFLWDAYRRSRTWYGLTDRRVIIVSAAAGRRADSVSLSGMSHLNLSERADGTGAIRLGPAPRAAFGPSSGPRGMLAGTGWPGVARHLAPTLERIEDAREVHDRIMEARDDLARAAAR